MGISTSLTESESSDWTTEVSERLREHTKTWREDTRYLSSLHEMVLHPAYQQVIGLGRDALPFLFEELKRQPDHWFWALQAIAGEDRYPPRRRETSKRDPRFLIGYLPLEFAGEGKADQERQAKDLLSKYGDRPRRYRNGIGLAIPDKKHIEALRRAIKFSQNIRVKIVNGKAREREFPGLFQTSL